MKAPRIRTQSTHHNKAKAMSLHEEFKDSGNVQTLIRAIRQITEPARRHRCIQCEQIFECHLCMIGWDHILHRGPWFATACDECINKKDIKTVFMENQKGLWHEYDLTTGEIIQKYPFLYAEWKGGYTVEGWRYQRARLRNPEFQKNFKLDRYFKWVNYAVTTKRRNAQGKTSKTQSVGARSVRPKTKSPKLGVRRGAKKSRTVVQSSKV